MKAYFVCIDPGHGPGCANRSPDGSYEEQEFAMDLAERIAGLLREHGVGVNLTRDAQGYPSLSQRCRTANSVPALDLFVSLHSNAAAGSGWQSPSGHMIFTSEQGAAAGRNRLAEAILDAWRKGGVSIRGEGLFHYGYTVLTDTKAPAVLLEHGFHTNRKEVAELKQDCVRDALARADAQGILAYLGIPWVEPMASDRDRVKARFGLEEPTMAYLEAYAHGQELLRKLAEGR